MFCSRDKQGLVIEQCKMCVSVCLRADERAGENQRQAGICSIYEFWERSHLVVSLISFGL